MPVNEFGKTLRILRMDRGEKLYDMANMLGVSSSFLSAVENNKKNIPKEWLKILREEYNLNDIKYKKLEDSFYLSQRSLNLDEMQNEQKEAVLLLARRFEDLSEQDKKSISKILGGNE